MTAVHPPLYPYLRFLTVRPVSDPGERTYTQSEIDSLVAVEELVELFGRLRGERVSRSYANRLATHRGFPAPLISRTQLRLWLRADVEAWLDRNRPGWREMPSV